MQVVYNTFPATLPLFLKLLKTCDFYAFDEEMTGVNMPKVEESVTFSTRKIYSTKRQAASHYNMMQVGLCLFHRVSSTDNVLRYTAHPFNFVLCPQPLDELEKFVRYNASRDVVMSSSALAFHRRYGMDFQAWVYQGIGFCDEAQAQVYRKYWAEKRDAGALEGTGKQAKEALLSEEERAWVADGLRRAAELQERADAVWQVNPTAEVPGGREVMLPPQVSRNAREHLADALKAERPRVTATFRRQTGTTVSCILCVYSEREVEAKLAKERASQACEEVSSLGFRLVFEALVNCRKPCVGHNCFLDLMFLFFALDRPLPEELVAWKARVSELFPTVLDTRYIATRLDLFPPGYFPKSHLAGLFEHYGLSSPRVEVNLPLGFQKYDPLTQLTMTRRGDAIPSTGAAAFAHEAAYDALMTGTVLVNLLADLGCDDVEKAPRDVVNKVAVFRSLYAIDLNQAHKDEYRPAEGGVLDIRHSSTTKWYQIEACIKATGVENAVLYDVDPERTLGVLPPSQGWEPEAIASTMKTKFPEIIRDVLLYTPLDLA